MASPPKFGPAAQTPAARALVLARMARALLHLRKPLPAHVQALHQRYLAGELSWLQVYLALDAPAPTQAEELHQR
ncbi:hypothetical protein HHL22_18675 [Hymenobacter sp. RP-2-7]|uniref:Uncharacterized protein n=1 Tax=Hymenobacter polaris TaxID=2682546 RepID=A0A7Y0AH15_9BACT|nr:hypothetical protein [Hymenobacter polaris]NML67234.1 hypothetical protein [Hymenobacter polaris]